MSELNESSTFWKLRIVKTLMKEHKLTIHASKKLPTTRKFSMPALMKEIKLVLLVKHEFEVRENLELLRFLGNFRTIRILMQMRKTMIFELNTRLQVPCFRF